MMKPIVLVALLALASGYRVGGFVGKEHGQICDVCIDTLEAIKSTTTSEELEALIKDAAITFCKLIPGTYKEECEKHVITFVTDNFQLIRSFVEIMPPQEVCKMFYLCPKTEAVLEGSICSVCTDIMALIRRTATDPALEKVAITYVDLACVAAGPLKGICKREGELMVSTLFKKMRQVFDMVKDDEVCQMIDMCPSNLTTPSISTCDVCKSTVAEIEGLILMDEIEQLAEDATKFVCSFVPSATLSKKCIEFAEDNIEEVIHAMKEFLNKYDPETVCSIAHFCSSGPIVGLPTVTPCEMCISTVSELEGLIVMDEVNAVVDDVINFVCSFVPTATMSNKCIQAAEQNKDELLMIVKNLIAKYDPKTICSLAQLCSSDSPLYSSVSLPAPEQICALCEDSLHLTRRVLTDPNLEVMVNTDIKFACKFAFLFHSTCEGYVDAFTETIFSDVRGIFEKFEDHKTCVLFDFCADGSNKTTVCDVCKGSFEEIKEFVTSEKLRTMVEAEANLACRVFGPLRRVCELEVDTVLNIVFNIAHMLDNVDGDKLCSKIRMC